MKRFCIGDIHGRLDALNSVLKQAKFDFKKDKLIVLGDVCDGGEQTKECIDILLKVKHCIFILGNHDEWALKWMKTGKILPIWWNQGGLNTTKSYGYKAKNVPKSHIKFLEDAPLYYEEDGNLFVHGGIDPFMPMEWQSRSTLLWDRSIIEFSMRQRIPGFKHVYIGHTTTQLIQKGCVYPLTFNNLTMLDTGGGWNGRLSMIDLDTDEVFQSKYQKPSEQA